MDLEFFSGVKQAKSHAGNRFDSIIGNNSVFKEAFGRQALFSLDGQRQPAAAGEARGLVAAGASNVIR
jgi:hypothetical protein